MDRLEAHRPVSSLIPGLPAPTAAIVAPLAANAGRLGPEEMVSVGPTRPLTPGTAVVLQFGAARPAATVAALPRAASGSAITPAVRPGRGAEPSGSVVDTLDQPSARPPIALDLHSVLTTDSDSSLSTAPSAAMPRPVAQGDDTGALIPSNPPRAPRASAHPAPHAEDEAHDFRPMTLSPPVVVPSPPTGQPSGMATGTGHAPSATAGAASPMTAADDSGGGCTPPDLTPPGLSGGWGDVSIQPVGTTGTEYEIPGGVPVGAVVTFMALGPGQGWTFDTHTLNWDGGTDYKAYFSDPGDTTPVYDSMQVTKGVEKWSDTYSFIVDADPRQYSIKFYSAYLDPCDGEDIVAPTVTITFNSVRPDQADLSATTGFESFFTANGKAWLKYSQYADPWNHNLATDNGLQILATTKAASFGSDFMFMQFTNSYRARTDDQ